MLYIYYFFFIVILSIVGKFNGLLGDSNFYYIYPFFSIIILFFIKFFFKEIKEFLIINSLLYYILAIVFYTVNFSVNDYGFFGNFDDSYFYSQGTSFLREGYIFDGPFDIFLGIMVNSGANDAFGAVAINWLFSTILLGLVYKLSKKINDNFKVYYLYALSLNYYFIESSILLFRDLLGLIFLILALLFIIEKKNKFHFFALCAILIRPMTGILPYIYYFLKNNKFINSEYRGKYLIIFFMFAMFLILYNYFPVGYLSGGSFESENSSFTLGGLNESRLDLVSSSETDITAKLISIGPVGIPFLMFLNIFTPLRFFDYYSDIEYTYLENGRYTTNYILKILNYKAILATIHIFVLSFWITPFLLGAFELVRSKKNKDILVIFIFILFIVSYISFQPRHKLHFLIFLPVICSFCKMSTKNIIVIGIVLDFFVYMLYFKWLL